MAGTVIVGAGECGVRAAFSLREKGYRGPVTLIGAEPHLPYERPPLSKGKCGEPKLIADENTYRSADVELMLDVEVTSIDRAAKRVIASGGRTFGYDMLLLATGARPRPLADMTGINTLRSIGDAQAIFGAIDRDQRLAIVGGGFIGLECAAVARSRGAAVTVVEAADQVMNRIVPEPIASLVAARHRTEGVELVLGQGVVGVSPSGVTLSSGLEIAADRVLVGIGALPNTDLAQDCGLEVADGIIVDRLFRTSDANVYAAGDCCRFPYRGGSVRLESWRAARDQADHAAGAMLGSPEPYAKVPWFWSDQYDLSLQVAGLPDRDSPFIRRDLADDAFLLFQQVRDGPLRFAAGVGPGNAVAKHIRLSEMIIERAVKVDATTLANPEIDLKAILRG